MTTYFAISQMCHDLGKTEGELREEYDEYCAYVVERGDGEYLEFSNYLRHRLGLTPDGTAKCSMCGGSGGASMYKDRWGWHNTSCAQCHGFGWVVDTKSSVKVG